MLLYRGGPFPQVSTPFLENVAHWPPTALVRDATPPAHLRKLAANWSDRRATNTTTRPTAPRLPKKFKAIQADDRRKPTLASRYEGVRYVQAQ